MLNQKWAILYLLYQLSDSEDPNIPTNISSFRSTTKTSSHERNISDGRQLQNPAKSRSRKEDGTFDDAFAPGGIPRLPTQDSARTENRRSNSTSTNNAANRREETALKTALLSTNYVEIDPPETTLLRDLPFTLQGLSSKSLPFSTLSGSRTGLKLPPTLPPPIISILHSLAEPSLLYKGLETFVHSSEPGLLGQSLRAAIAGELRSYLGLVATLEGQIRQTLSNLDEELPRGGIGKVGVTLKRMVVWTREATMGLRLLSLIAGESKSKRGGQLISLIHGFSSSHGDPLVGAFAERLLTPVTRPFYDMLRHWIYDGELSDPYYEFFVSEQDPNKIKEGDEGRTRTSASSVWEDKYDLDSNMIPTIVTEDFAQKVFLIGKSLNFIRYSCGDSVWVEQYSKTASKELRYGDTATLEAWIDEAYKTTMARLMHLMTDKFHLYDHLKALKDYILLGQGDFIALLMESLSANLDRPAGAQYRHTLTAQLEHAIRGSNAQYDSPEVLRRLDARMLQLSHGDIGWDCFTLEYKVDAPVDVVVTAWGNRQYLKVFNFLWHVKRVEFVLATTWRKCMTGARGVLQTSDKTVSETWKSTRGEIAAMIHFIGQLQYYILFEVIESSWDKLQKEIHAEGCTLNDLIAAHVRYLHQITHKGLLGGKKGGTSHMSVLNEIFKVMLFYRDGVDGLYSWSVADFSRRQDAELRGGTIDTTSGTDSVFPELKNRLGELGRQFRRKVTTLLVDLTYQPDADMRFLAVVMNFNDFYKIERPLRERAAGSSRK